VLFDASELQPDSAKSLGIYRYARMLLGTMVARQQPGDQILLVCHGQNLSDFMANLKPGDVEVQCVRPSMPGHLWRQWWTRAGCALAMRRWGGDVYLSPKGSVPHAAFWPGSAPRVSVLHDLIPFWYTAHRPGYFGRMESMLVSSAFRHTLRHADRLIAISQTTASELQAHGVSRRRISVIRNGVELVPLDDSGSALPAGLPDRFMFTMATRLPHKNLDGVLSAYARYRALVGDAALPLALCGTADVKQPGVLALGRVSEVVLRALYARAELFVFLSLTEGFGYPPVEALRVGTPVLCSDISALREVNGALAHYVDPSQPQAVGEAMAAMCERPWTPDQRQQLSRAAQERIMKKLSWSACADGVWMALRKVDKRPASGRGVQR
jgi:glycosyltransferase involved in cell wall biosynthesis